MTIKPYYETELGKLYHGDCLQIMPELEPVDLVLTSPPYDNLRSYRGYSFSWRQTIICVREILKQGAVCVWVVSDETKNGSESGTSFRQALWFIDSGLNLHDTMFYKKTPMPLTHNRYEQAIEYMFVFSYGKPKTFNPIMVPCSQAGKSLSGSTRRHTGGHEKTPLHKPTTTKGHKIKDNVWEYGVGFNKTTQDRIAYEHPAIFPELLAHDHILSWSNKGDTVADIMCGSGTTLKQAEKLERKWIGIEIEEKYCEIAAKRIEQERKQLKLF